jgi:hypothetical protein
MIMNETLSTDLEEGSLRAGSRKGEGGIMPLYGREDSLYVLST